MTRFSRSVFIMMSFACGPGALAQVAAPDVPDTHGLCALPEDATITLRSSIAVPEGKDSRSYASSSLTCHISGNRNPITTGTYRRQERRSATCSGSTLSMRFRSESGAVVSIECTARDIRAVSISDFRALFGSLSGSTHASTPFFRGTVSTTPGESRDGPRSYTCGGAASESTSSDAEAQTGYCSE